MKFTLILKHLICLLLPFGFALFSSCSQQTESTINSPLPINFSLGEFGDELVDSQEKPVDVSTIEKKFLGIYFSAYWCPPCRAFTPKLIDFRNQNKENFEVVFVSSDGSKEEQFQYIKEAQMPWLTLPQDSTKTIELSEKFEVEGIPTLIIISPDGKTLTKNGRADVMQNPNSAISTWKKVSDG